MTPEMKMAVYRLLCTLVRLELLDDSEGLGLWQKYLSKRLDDK